MTDRILIEETKHAGKTIKIFQDPDPINPRVDYDNLTEIVHWHRRYNLGKKVDHLSAKEMISDYRERGNPILAILPLYLSDHSGISISTSGFSCSFDSGQVGWAFITQSQSDMMGCEDWSKETYEAAIKGDVETYDNYLTGRVYGYVVEGRDGKELESEWGFFGDKSDCLWEGIKCAEKCEDPAVLHEVEAYANVATYAGI